MAQRIVLIPARVASTRLPAKPLALINGEPMIAHVWRRAMAADVGMVLVAADDERIVGAIEKIGGAAVLTRPDHASGSDRIHEAVGAYDPEGRYAVVVNLQGDLPTIAPEAVRAAVAPLEDDDVDIATIATPITRPEERDDPNVVKAIGAEIAPGRLR
ncbi:MAG TPA: NTP transferase domain-containing protein, partial [Roseiarcus sp.]|nr:NTP transferase domain-containing protein [Roseiarcus sp.]